MSNSIVIENLGHLAAKAELDAARTDLTTSERIHLMDLANRYREAQCVELLKLAGKEAA